MKKNKIIFLLTICLLFTFSCDNLIQSQKSGDCYVSLSIGKVQTGRTIMPSPENIKFSRYELLFTQTGDTKGKTITEKWLNGKSYGTVSLSAGTYNLVVTAYIDTDSEEPDAQKNVEITVIAGQKNEINLNLDVNIKKGQGTFRWDITYSVDISAAIMTVTPLSENATEEQNLSFECNDYKPVNNVSSLNLNTGYYRVVINLIDGNARTAEFNEILHIYNGMESVLKYEFIDAHFTINIIVTTENDSISETGAPLQGSLRWALEQATARTNSTIIVDSSKMKKNIIMLQGQLDINLPYEAPKTYITIEGNGVILMKNIGGDETLLSINNYSYYDLQITIRRIHFKDGYGESCGAIYNHNGNINLESCIFSGNKTNYYGGAINSSGKMNIIGCTFYNNYAGEQGGAIKTTGTLNLQGNLFYGNKAGDSDAVISGSGITSLGYNIVDVKFQEGVAPSSDTTSINHCGWTKGVGDKYINSPIITFDTFKLLNNNANILPDTLGNYPTIDFYGYPIKAGGAAGAVQEKAQ